MSLDEHQLLRELLERAKATSAIDPALPVDTFLRSFTWLIYGYFATGPIGLGTMVLRSARSGAPARPAPPRGAVHPSELRKLVVGDDG
jgi:hypothetical protein